MTKYVTIQGHVYSDGVDDEGTDVRYLGNGGHRENLIPMLDDTVAELTTVMTAIAGAADAVAAVAADRVAVEAKSSQVSQDALAVAADLDTVQTLANQVSTNALTVAADRAAVEAKSSQVSADALSVAEDRGAVETLASQVSADAQAVAADRAAVEAKSSQVSADALSVAADRVAAAASASAAAASAAAQNRRWAGTSAGSINALVLTPATPLTSYDGAVIDFIASGTNSGAATVAVSGLAAVAIHMPDGTALVGGTLVGGTMYRLVYDGMAFRLASGAAAAGAGGGLTVVSATTDLTATVNSSIVCAAASLIIVTLPDSPIVGSRVEVAALGAGGFKLLTASGQTIYDGGQAVGTGLALYGQQGVVLELAYIAVGTWLVTAGRGLATIAVAAADPLFGLTTAYLPFNGSAADLSGNGLSVVAQSLTYGPGKFGQAAIFDGVSSAVTLPAGYGTSAFAGDFCLQSWVRFSGTGEKSWYVAKGGGAYFAINISASAVVLYLNSGSVTASMACTITTTGFDHLAVFRVGSLLTVALNGIPIGSVVCSGVVGYPSSVAYIGGNVVDGVFWAGQIDSFQIKHGGSPYTGKFTVPSLPPAAQPETAFDPLANNVLLNLGFNNNLADQSFNGLSVSNSGLTFTTDSRTGTHAVVANGSSTASITDTRLAIRKASFTFEAWVKPTAPGQTNYSGILNWSTGGLGICQTAGAYTVSLTVVGTGVFMTTTLAMNQNAWNKVAVTRIADTFLVWINGQAAGVGSSTVDMTQSTVYLAGYPSPSAYLTGQIDQLRLTVGRVRIAAAQAVETTAFPTAYPTGYDPLWGLTTALLPMDGDLTDSSASGLVLSGANLAWDTVGKFGQAASFNGTSTTITCAAPGAATKLYGDFTLEGFVSLTAVNNNALIETRTASGSVTGLALRVNSAGKLSVYTSTEILVASSTITTGVWHHFAMVRAGNLIFLTIDGVMVASAALTTALSDGGLRLGAFIDGTGPLAGMIDMLRITHAARYFGNHQVPAAAFLARAA